MRRTSRRWNGGGYHRHEWLYALVIMAAVMMVPACLCVMLWLMPSAIAANNWQVEGPMASCMCAVN
ncbi:Uncharacterised protein [Serratia plymuthica]|uniref:Uncharacterized protein n=1 Tax=Serratia plymuthica TaxID=82996 RepID=A0A2X4XCK7_SERPL|nr:Uncharacterised protein [Serratia plymuthica]